MNVHQGFSGDEKCTICVVRVYFFINYPLRLNRVSLFCILFQILFPNESLLPLCSVYCQKYVQLFNKIYAIREDEEQNEIFPIST